MRLFSCLVKLSTHPWKPTLFLWLKFFRWTCQYKTKKPQKTYFITFLCFSFLSLSLPLTAHTAPGPAPPSQNHSGIQAGVFPIECVCLYGLAALFECFCSLCVLNHLQSVCICVTFVFMFSSAGSQDQVYISGWNSVLYDKGLFSCMLIIIISSLQRKNPSCSVLAL